jgi:hypothetical protein
MSELAMQLQQIISKFKIDEDSDKASENLVKVAN